MTEGTGSASLTLGGGGNCAAVSYSKCGGAGIVLPFKGVLPRVAKDVFLAPTSVLTGDIEVGEGSGIWFGAIVRGDVNTVRIGKNVNIQDGAVCHVSYQKFGLIIEDDVTIGHGAVLHGCTVKAGAFIGMRATVLDGAVIESGAMVAAGALVPPGKVVKSGELWAGTPAKFMRLLTQEEKDYIPWSAQHYKRLAAEHTMGEPAREDGREGK